jgi:serine/threonine-protein kinase
VRDAERPGEERAKVLDFGLAKVAAELIRGEPDEDSSSPEEGRGLTEPHMAMGSPAYMAPEQWQSASDVSPKADVYALGVILYESHPIAFSVENTLV